MTEVLKPRFYRRTMAFPTLFTLLTAPALLLHAVAAETAAEPESESAAAAFLPAWMLIALAVVMVYVGGNKRSVANM